MENDNKKKEQCTIQNVSCFYLVYVDVDHEGIKEDLEVFRNIDDAKKYVDENNVSGEWAGIGEYKYIQLNVQVQPIGGTLK